METNHSFLQDLVDRPRESLSIELKRWIDPSQPEGIAKIVRALLALRNHGGGYLVIGFDDKLLQPDTEHAPIDVEAAFHVDTIQALVSKYASEPFEVAVHFVMREGQKYPILEAPVGIKVPVAARADLNLLQKKFIAVDDVYVRTLSSNNTPSTSRAGWKDWSHLIEVCLDNREADIGRFLRRHLGALSPDILDSLATSVRSGLQAKPSQAQVHGALLDDGYARYSQLVRERKLSLPPFGTWQVSLSLVGIVPPHSANQAFLNLLASSNPNLTGWPVWLDTRNFSDQSAHPFVANGAWEYLSALVNVGWLNHVDFASFNPKGTFYLLRALEDDISGSDRAPKPMTALDFGLPVVRTVEAIAVGLAFARAMGCDSATTTLSFAFRWTEIKSRNLVSWANVRRHMSPGRVAYQDSLTSFVDVPAETPLSSLAEYVNRAVKPLFEVFQGFELGQNVIEDVTRQVISRSL